MKLYYLYKIVNQINGKLYVGITSQPEKRKQRHFSKHGHSAFSIIRLAMDKYGKNNFSFEIICIGEKEYILDLEVKAISLYRTREKEFGYNIKQGGQSGAGYLVGGSTKDIPVFVSGFWFPNRRTAVKSLGITVHIYKNRQKEGTLGDIVRLRKDKSDFKQPDQTPRYVGGFWFPSFKVAAKALSKPYQTIVGRVAKGQIEQHIKKRIRDQSGESNHMYGINPKEHPSSVSVIVNNIKYDSIKQATADTGFSKYIINSRIKENHPDFQYA